MMLTGYNTQDTLKPKLIIRINTDNLLPDSVFRKLDEVPSHIRNIDSAALRKRTREPIPEFIITDSTSVSSRNSIGDFTLYDSNSLFSNPVIYPHGQFPFMLIGKQTEVHQQKASIIAGPLMDGIRMPENPLRYDWITAFMFVAALGASEKDRHTDSPPPSTDKVTDVEGRRQLAWIHAKSGQSKCCVASRVYGKKPIAILTSRRPRCKRPTAAAGLVVCF